MKILTDGQIKGADMATIEREPVESINLMERAAEVIAQWICNNVEQECDLFFVVGKGNNGGDGLAVARMLYHVGYNCSIYMALGMSDLSEDCRYNLDRLPSGVALVDSAEIELNEQTVVIDALLGTGVKSTLQGNIASIVEMINSLPNRVISIDIPSGMDTEFSNADRLMVCAETTLTLEFPKLAMLLPEAGEHCGNIVVLPIELDAEYIASKESNYYYVTESVVQQFIKPREKFAHKNTYGHTLLICGSEGMMGAAILATSAALRSGCGLVTTHIPREERSALHASCPSALLSLDPHGYFSKLPAALERFTSIGVGSGVGQSPDSAAALRLLLETTTQPMVIDADALNIISTRPELFSMIHSGSILTPHPGELRRLVGEWRDEQHKIELVCQLAASTSSVVVVKGAHSMICVPQGKCYFNSTGDSGMAKGGSGDLLTGLLAGLLSRGYSASQAAVLGVYIHGLAGEKAAQYYGSESMNSSDMVDFLAEAFVELK